MTPKPTWQHDTGCSKRTVADVSAVADPATGVAVYQTYGASGWVVYGGTSVASPIIASVYADAGTPGGSTYPAANIYSHTGSLYDVTTGRHGTCSPVVPVHRRGRLRRPDRLGHPQRPGRFRRLTPRVPNALHRPGPRQPA